LVELHDRQLPLVLADSTALALTYANNRSTDVDAQRLFAGIVKSRDSANGATGKWLAARYPSLPFDSTPVTAATDYRAWFTADTRAVTPAVRAILERARLFAASHEQVHVWHLLAGMLCTSEPEVDAIWRRQSIDPLELLRALQGFVQVLDGAEAAFWRQLIERQTSRLGETIAGYTNDRSTATAIDDRLGFTRSARALASIVSWNKTEPPLAVGVLGKWGSGKSFFLNLMREAIEKSATAEAEHRKSHSSSFGYCSKVVQIEFNAWQYMDSNLWASLITHIFNELNLKLGGGAKTAATYVEELASVKQELALLVAKKAPLVEEIGLLNKKIEETVPDLESALRGNTAVQDAVETLKTRLGIKPSAEPRKELQVQARKLETIVGKFVAWLKLVRNQPTALITVAAVALVPVVLTAVVDRIPRDIGAGTTIVAGIAAILAQIVKRVGPIADEIEKAIDEAREVDDPGGIPPLVVVP